MHKHLFRIFIILILIHTSLPMDNAFAANNITFAGACRIKRPAGVPYMAFSVSAALHNNGLLYVAVNNGANKFSEAGGGFFISAYDPNFPTPDANGICQPVASYVVQSPQSALNSGKGRAKQMPVIVKSDPDGNVYVGRVSYRGFRMLMIDASAPATAQGAFSYDHMYSFSIEGAVANTNSGGGFDVSDDYVLASISGDMVFPNVNRFTVISKNTLLALGTIASNQTPDQAAGGIEVIKAVAGTWDRIQTSGITNAYSKFISPTDAVVALPDGKFFVAAGFETSKAYLFGAVLAGFVDPATRAVTNVYTGASGWTDFCGAKIKPPFTNARNPPYGFLVMCHMPSAYMGRDNNLYVGVRGNNGMEQAIVRYNLSLQRWESPKGEPNIAYVQNKTYFENAYQQVKFSNGIAADGAGQVFIGNINNNWNAPRQFGPVDIAYYNLTDDWKKIQLSLGGKEYGKPHLMITPYSGESGRLSVFYVRDIWAWKPEADAIWAQYKGNVYYSEVIDPCTVNMIVNGGLTYLNATNANVALYSTKSCNSTQYYAVASNSATPPASVNLANLGSFDQANGAINVTGLTSNTDNYIHVKLYDENDTETTSWFTQKVYVDTDATVGATVSISSPFTKPRYTDVSTMDGSSYTDSTFVRSNVGLLSVDAVSDPSGLSSYTVNSGQPVNYSEALLGQGSLVLMRENTGSMGADLVLRDGAGNTENRSIYTLTLDAEPPVATGASVAFSATGTSPFNGEVTLTPGTSSDNEGIWGLWLASAYCGANNSTCPANTSSDLRWGAAPLTSNVAEWNLLTGNNIPMSDGVYRVYARLLDGAGNPSATFMTADVTVTMSNTTVFAPIMYAER